MENPPVNGSKFRIAFLLILVAGVTLLFLAVIWPFLQALLFGAIFAGLGLPLFRALLRLCRGHRGAASAATIALMFLVIAGPVSALVGLVVKQAIEVSAEATPWLQKQAASPSQWREWLAARLPGLGEFMPSRQELAEHVGNATRAAGAFVIAGASSFTKGTAGFLLNLFVMVYAMFFFLKDGRKILEQIFYYMPLNHQDEIAMLERFTAVTAATIKGTIIIGLIQGTLGGLAFFAAGIGGAAFWGALMVVLSVLPGVGTAVVWVPAVVYLFFSGQNVTAVLLLAWCAGVVGTIDNLLRPRLVGKDARMPDLMILLGTLGGLYLFGPLGFIVGPIVCGLFLTIWEIYGVAFRDILPPVKNLGGGAELPPGKKRRA